MSSESFHFPVKANTKAEVIAVPEILQLSAFAMLRPCRSFITSFYCASPNLRARAKYGRKNAIEDSILRMVAEDPTWGAQGITLDETYN